jgi:hypothetical protein
MLAVLQLQLMLLSTSIHYTAVATLARRSEGSRVGSEQHVL